MAGGRHKTVADVMHHIVDTGDLLDRVATGEVHENVTHHPPEQAQAVDGGE